MVWCFSFVVCYRLYMALVGDTCIEYVRWGVCCIVHVCVVAYSFVCGLSFLFHYY